MSIHGFRRWLPNVLGLGALVVTAGWAFGTDTSARISLAGTWQLQGSSNESGRWTIEDKGNDVFKLTQTRGDQKITEFECTTTGHECEVKESGKPVKISMWFNGGKLVQLETKGRDVIKRGFSVAEPGNILEVEVIPIVPEGKPEKIHYRRAQ